MNGNNPSQTQKNAHLNRRWLLVWTSIFFFVFLGIIPSMVFRGLGINLALFMIGVLSIITWRALPLKEFGSILTLSLVFGVITVLLDLFSAQSRPELFSSNIQAIISASLIVLIIAFFLLTFQQYPVQLRLVIAIGGISTLAVFSLAFGIKTVLKDSIVQSNVLALNSSAARVGRDLDSAIVDAQMDLRNQAYLPLYAKFLTTMQNEEQTDIKSIWDNLLVQGKQAAQNNTPQNYIIGFSLINKQGKILLDTQEKSVGMDISGLPYFQPAIHGKKEFVSDIFFADDNQPYIYIIEPVMAEKVNDTVLGFLTARYQIGFIQRIVLQANDLVGPQSFAILLDENGLQLARGQMPIDFYKLVLPIDLTKISKLQELQRLPAGDTSKIVSLQASLASELSKSEQLQNIKYEDSNTSPGQTYIASISSMAQKPWRVIYSQSETYLSAPIVDLNVIIQLISLGLVSISILAAFAISAIIVKPIKTLALAASARAKGETSARVKIDTDDEIKELSNSMETMGDRLQRIVMEMEKRINERTVELENRSKLMQAATEVGRIAATYRDLDVLLPKISRLISERFGYYHVGIFLLDDTGEYAVLRASNSDGGQRLLKRNHKLQVGRQGIVGYVAGSQKPRIALDVGEDAIFLTNPELPLTRSEMALPLLAGGKVLGALDIQSVHSNAFSEETISVMQVAADLLAVAIENASLFSESKAALVSMRKAYGDVSEKSWIERMASKVGISSPIGYRSIERGSYPINLNENQNTNLEAENAPFIIIGNKPEPETLSKSASRLSIPIKVRDNVIGFVDTFKSPDTGRWSSEEQEAINSLVDQLGVALESARLYENSQLQTQREHLVGELTSRLQESLDVDNVLRAAVIEIRTALGLNDVSIVLGERPNK